MPICKKQDALNKKGDVKKGYSIRKIQREGKPDRVMYFCNTMTQPIPKNQTPKNPVDRKDKKKKEKVEKIINEKIINEISKA